MKPAISRVDPEDCRHGYLKRFGVDGGSLALAGGMFKTGIVRQ